MKKQIIIISLSVILLFALFAFTSWRNAYASYETPQNEKENSLASLLGGASPFLIGLLTMIVLAFLISTILERHHL